MPENIIGERMASLRKGAGESQEDLAKVLQCSRGTVANYEVGKRTPDVGTLVRIAQHYNTTVDYLVGNSDSVSKEAELKAVCDYLGVSDEMVRFLRRLRRSNPMKLRIIDVIFSQKCQQSFINLIAAISDYAKLHESSFLSPELEFAFLTENNPELKKAMEVCNKNDIQVLGPYDQKLHAKMMMDDAFSSFADKLASSICDFYEDSIEKRLSRLICAKTEDELTKIFLKVELGVDPESDEGNADNG